MDKFAGDQLCPLGVGWTNLLGMQGYYIHRSPWYHTIEIHVPISVKCSHLDSTTSCGKQVLPSNASDLQIFIHKS